MSMNIEILSILIFISRIFGLLWSFISCSGLLTSNSYVSTDFANKINTNITKQYNNVFCARLLNKLQSSNYEQKMNILRTSKKSIENVEVRTLIMQF